MKILFKALILSCLAMAGCKEKPPGAGGGPPGAPAGAMQMQVVVAEAKRQPVAEKIALVGNLLANEAIEIKSEIDGTILEINFKEGQRVEKGHLLVRLDERKLAATVAEAEANFKLSETTYKRTKQLYEDKLLSQQEFDQANSSFMARQADLDLKRQELKDTRLVAPFAGIVGARNISPGQVISRNTILTWLTDLDTLKVDMNVPERFSGQLKPGQNLSLRVAAYPGEEFKGELYFVSPALDEVTRTVLVRARLPNPDAKLKPGMFASLDLTVAVRENAIVIPERGLTRVMDKDRAMIFLVDEKGTAQMKQVKLGIRLPGEVEIVEGLQGGEKVIVEGFQKIGPGMPVKIASTK